MGTLTASEPLTKGITIAKDMPSWGMPSLFVLTRCKAGGSGLFSPAPCTIRARGWVTLRTRPTHTKLKRRPLPSLASATPHHSQGYRSLGLPQTSERVQHDGG